MKAGLRRLLKKALYFLGEEPQNVQVRPGKESKAAPIISAAVPGPVAVDSKQRAPSLEIRPVSELDRYEHLVQYLDTRVLLDSGWLMCLGASDAWRSMSKLKQPDLRAGELAALELSAKVFDLFSHFAADYTDLTCKVISLTPPSYVTEKRKASRSMGSVETIESVVYNRWRASTSAWAASCRARTGTVEIFLVPASELMALSQAETPLRLRLRLEMLKVSASYVWTCNGLPVSAEDLRFFTRMLFKDLVCATLDEEQSVQSISTLNQVDDDRLARSVEQLLLERQGLAQKVVIQQEEIQKRIARDLHDAVISDVMALKRNIASDKPVVEAETLESLDIIVRKLREICYDLSPRDLSDWGLSTVVDDMLDQIAQRTGIDCVLNCDVEIPNMPAAVLLHIYRIIQESLNNAEKYAEPSRLVVTMEMNDSVLTINIQDDGKGFEPYSSDAAGERRSGYGMGSLKERANLIRCFYPTQFSVDSAPGKGTKVRLEVDFSKRL